MALFVSKLAELRHQGIHDYDALRQIQSTNFDEKWIQWRAGHEAEFLSSPESTSLAAYGLSYSNIENLKPVPADRAAIIALAISIGVSSLPAVLAVIPLIVVIEDLPKALR